CCFPHTAQPAQRVTPALNLRRGRLLRVFLGRSSSLRTLRRQLSVFVRALRRYYTTVRLSTNVHFWTCGSSPSPTGPLPPSLGIGRASRISRVEFPYMRGSLTSQSPMNACFSHPPMLPSAIMDDVGTLIF